LNVESLEGLQRHTCNQVSVNRVFPQDGTNP
jgi:hypothetical protein